MLKNIFSNCNITNTEQSVLLHLLRYGDSIASLISKRTGIKRPTVYAALDSLVKRGLVLESKRDHIIYFKAQPPAMIASVLQTQAEQSFLESTQSINLLEKHLKSVQNEDISRVNDFAISGINNVEAIYAQLGKALKSGSFVAMFNPQLALKSVHVRKIVQEFLAEHQSSKPSVRELVVSGPETDWYKALIKNPNHHIKEIPQDEKLFSDIILVNGEVIISNYGKDKETGLKIVEPEFYQSMYTLFEMLWAKY